MYMSLSTDPTQANHTCCFYFPDIIDRLTIEPNTNKRFAVVDGLKPGNLYIFRLRAVNKFGIGLASLPSGI